MEKVKVLFCSKQYPLTVKFLKKHLDESLFYITSCEESEIKDEIKDAHVCVPLMAKITGDVISKGENLKLIHQFGVGLEGVDVKKATEKGIYVANIPANKTGNAYSVSELTLFLILALLKNWNEAKRSFQEKKIGVPLGDVMIGKKFMVLGYGNVGKAIVRILRKFSSDIVVVRREVKNRSTRNLKFVSYKEAFDILPTVDFLIAAISLTPSTRDFIDESFFDKIKKGAFFINVSRGGVVKYSALLSALKSGKLKGAGLDVYWDEPFDPSDEIFNYNVIATPHIAGSTNYSYNLMAEFMAENIKRVFNEGKKPVSCVNFKS